MLPRFVVSLAATSTLVAPVLEPLANRAIACTTAVVSGSATVDGRPLLWKNRDTKNRDNETIAIEGGKYPIVAVANAGERGAIWMGMNAAGLCIENSVSEDLKAEGKAKGPGNGGFMLLALKTCTTVEEVADLCRRTDVTGRSTMANIGVIDATGAAAVFEVGPRTHVRFDVRPEAAPRGYVVRSNFSMTAHRLDGDPEPAELAGVYSSDRYARACSLIERGKAEGLDVAYFLRSCTRDLADDQGRAVPGSVNAAGIEARGRIDTAHTISRKSTVSAAVFQGVLPGESPKLTTMWTFLGDPTFSISVPCWATSLGTAPELDGERASQLCSRARELRDSCYVDGAAIRAERLSEIYRRTWAVEDEIVRRTEERLVEWRKSPPSDEELFALHRETARLALEGLESLVEDFAETPAATK